MFCAADIRKHKELIEQYDRATGQYVVTIVEKRAREFHLSLPSFLDSEYTMKYTKEMDMLVNCVC